MKLSIERDPDDKAITEWQQDMQLRSASYRVLNSSGWAMRRLVMLVAKAAFVALLLAVAAWLMVALIV